MPYSLPLSSPFTSPLTSPFVGSAGGTPVPPAPTVPEYSLSLNGTNQYLSMSNANWGAYDRAKFAIAGSIYVDSLAATRAIITRDDQGGAGREFRLFIQTNGTLTLGYYPQADLRESASGAITVGNWFSFLVYFDYLNGTAADRAKMWINGTPTGTTSAPPNQIVATVDTPANVGIRLSSGSPTDYFDGLQYSLGFFSGTLPDPTDIFDGTAGKVKDFTGLAGLYRYLTVKDGVVTYDAVLDNDTAWINNNTVTASATIP